MEKNLRIRLKILFITTALCFSHLALAGNYCGAQSINILSQLGDFASGTFCAKKNPQINFYSLIYQTSKFCSCLGSFYQPKKTELSKIKTDYEQTINQKKMDRLIAALASPILPTDKNKSCGTNLSNSLNKAIQDAAKKNNYKKSKVTESNYLKKLFNGIMSNTKGDYHFGKDILKKQIFMLNRSLEKENSPLLLTKYSNIAENEDSFNQFYRSVSSTATKIWKIKNNLLDPPSWYDKINPFLKKRDYKKLTSSDNSSLAFNTIFSVSKSQTEIYHSNLCAALNKLSADISINKSIVEEINAKKTDVLKTIESDRLLDLFMSMKTQGERYNFSYYYCNEYNKFNKEQIQDKPVGTQIATSITDKIARFVENRTRTGSDSAGEVKSQNVPKSVCDRYSKVNPPKPNYKQLQKKCEKNYKIMYPYYLSYPFSGIAQLKNSFGKKGFDKKTKEIEDAIDNYSEDVELYGTSSEKEEMYALQLFIGLHRNYNDQLNELDSSKLNLMSKGEIKRVLGDITDELEYMADYQSTLKNVTDQRLKASLRTAYDSVRKRYERKHDEVKARLAALKALFPERDNSNVHSHSYSGGKGGSLANQAANGQVGSSKKAENTDSGNPKVTEKADPKNLDNGNKTDPSQASTDSQTKQAKQRQSSTNNRPTNPTAFAAPQRKNPGYNPSATTRGTQTTSLPPIGSLNKAATAAITAPPKVVNPIDDVINAEREAKLAELEARKQNALANSAKYKAQQEQIKAASAAQVATKKLSPQIPAVKPSKNLTMTPDTNAMIVSKAQRVNLPIQNATHTPSPTTANKTPSTEKKAVIAGGSSSKVQRGSSSKVQRGSSSKVQTRTPSSEDNPNSSALLTFVTIDPSTLNKAERSAAVEIGPENMQKLVSKYKESSYNPQVIIDACNTTQEIDLEKGGDCTFKVGDEYQTIHIPSRKERQQQLAALRTAPKIKPLATPIKQKPNANAKSKYVPVYRKAAAINPN